MMKSLHIGWDAPVGVDVDHYLLRSDVTEPQIIHGTDGWITVPEDWAGRVSVCSVVETMHTVVSKPCEIWYEEFKVYIGWGYGKVNVFWNSKIGREYALEYCPGNNPLWTDAGLFVGTGESISHDVETTERRASFRVWSKEIKENAE